MVNNRSLTNLQLVKYTDVLPEIAYSVSGRSKIHRGRQQGNQDSFFGFSPAETTATSFWERVKNFSVDGGRWTIHKMARDRGMRRVIKGRVGKCRLHFYVPYNVVYITTRLPDYNCSLDHSVLYSFLARQRGVGVIFERGG